MTSKQDYKNKCFSPNWLEIDLEQVSERQAKKEVCLEDRQRKNLDTLLKELDEIRQNIEKVAEKQQRLANLMGFYSGEFAN